MRTICGHCWLTMRKSSAPSICGICTSVTMTSKGDCARSSNACAPPSTNDMSHSERSRCSRDRSPASTCTSSSTKRIRFMGSLPFSWLHQSPWSPKPSRPSYSNSRAGCSYRQMPELPRVIVIGGGFGGLSAVRALRSAAVDILLVDRGNHHTFQPLLYQVATAGLAAPSIAAPLRHILRSQSNVTVLLGEARRIDVEARTVDVDGVLHPYDFLIVATGSTHAYFGHDEWSRYAPGLKTLDDALRIRARILTAFERAEATADPAEQMEWLTFLIVGAGATGVELAGTLAEIARHTLKREFRHIDPATARVLLVEAGPRVLPAFPPSLSAKARRQLERLGVLVRTGHAVSGLD